MERRRQTGICSMIAGRANGLRLLGQDRYRLRCRALALLAVASMLMLPLAGMAGEPPAAGEPGEDVAGRPSLLELIVKGGPVMVPIGLCSLVAVAVAVERSIGLRRNRIIPDGFMEGLPDAFGPQGNDLEGAVAYCRRTPSPISNILIAGIGKLGRKLEIVEKAVEDAAAREVFRMKRGLEALAVIGTISPLLGLLGTIYGMIGAFRMAAEKGLGRAESLATGIYEALVTTAAGMTVAVPTLLVYYVLMTRVERLTEQVEQIGNEFLDQCHEDSSVPGAGPIPANPWRDLD